ncbi:DUF4342 domain-containing protein [Paradesulfitobacterium ferrireducens]|uniref:DUF4342 domain-containing protein n=1 Tax=Paradesulfitobacterium ferrireducens TaxID=2816476 RepID=UPI001A8F519E|nr:DUF4342 domain-containing protein [Paradesulfitobacterium ferrireducens]
MNEEMWSELEKIDILRERMGVGYDEASKALKAAGGDVIRALADLESEQKAMTGTWKNRGREVWEDVKDKMEALNQTKVNLKRRDKTLLSVSAPLGAALAYTFWRRPGLRLLGLLGAAGAALAHYELEVDKTPVAEPVVVTDTVIIREVEDENDSEPIGI